MLLESAQYTLVWSEIQFKMKHAWFPVTLSFVLTHSSDKFNLYIYIDRYTLGM